jgi:hypothetical protein
VLFKMISRSGLLVLLVLVCSTTCMAGEGGNLLANPGFELGRELWNLGKGGKTEASLKIDGEDGPPGGGQSALISVGKIDSWGVQFGQNIDGGKKGKTYTFAALVKGVSEGAKVSLQIERRADPYDRAATTKEKVLSDKWAEIHVTFKLEKEFKEGWFAYVSCTRPDTKFRVTQLRIYEGEFVPFKERSREENAVAGVSIFDVGRELDKKTLMKGEGWTQLAEDDVKHAFKGNVVVMNNRLALVLGTEAQGAELYSMEGGKSGWGFGIRPATGERTTFSGVKILENNPGGCTIQASFKREDGRTTAITFEMKMGQPFVQVLADDSIKGVRVVGLARYAVMPDFFADDIVFDPRLIKADQAELPSDSFLLNMMGEGDAIQMAVWTNRREEVRVSLSGDKPRVIAYTDIPCGKNEKVWLAALGGKGIWHTHDVAKTDAGKVVQLDWKPPMPAMWRVDWRRDDGLADSWEMIMQKAGGEFLKQRMVGSAETLPENRRRWNTVLGTFAYPCWIGKDGQASLQPLKSKVKWSGPAVIYPLGRVAKTPLDAFTVVDVVRATLGVGPCEYILDLEGQQGQYKGVATCANRDKLNPIYEKGEQVERKKEVEKSLTDVVIFIRHIRSRIETYRAFGHEVSAYLAEQKAAHPELATPLDELDLFAKVIDQRIAARRVKIKTPDEAAAMVEAFRQNGMNDTSADAFKKCKEFTASIVEIGDNQDELAGECRLAVKILRQEAAMVEAKDPRVAEMAKEIRARSQKVLRNPANHEGAGH